MEPSNGRAGPLLQTGWLDSVTQMDLRTALASNQNIWLDDTRRRGFMRTTFDPRVEADDVQRNRFLIAARSAAETSGPLWLSPKNVVAGFSSRLASATCGIRRRPHAKRGADIQKYVLNDVNERSTRIRNIRSQHRSVYRSPSPYQAAGCLLHNLFREAIHTCGMRRDLS
jgi:hypothetical protein